MTALDWIGLLHEESADQAGRYVLLADPETTALAPLLDRLLLQAGATTNNLWENGRWRALLLRDAL